MRTEQKFNHAEYLDQMRIEEQYYDYFCLIKPTEEQQQDYLERFSSLSLKDKSNALIESKKWGNHLLTNKMQQLF